MNFEGSQTKINLMRAFAGESQARNRYIFAADMARDSKMYVVEYLFKFTAEQEEQHAKLFYEKLMDAAGSNITIDGNYPIDLYTDVVRLLRCAEHNEFQEYENDYASFAQIAKKEGFEDISLLFGNIAGVERIHGQRFKKFAELVENNQLYISNVETKWMCLKCGYVYEGNEPPKICPVCKHDRGYYVRLEMLPFGSIE